MDDWLSALIGGAFDYTTATQNAFLGDFFGRKQRSKQSKLSYEMANYEAALNYQYSKLYNEQNYELAQRYAQNSAKWARTGLEKAGLNPLLAAGQGFNASFGQAGVSSETSVDMPGLASNPQLSTPAIGAQVVKAASELKLNRATAKNLDTQNDVIKANAAKTFAEADKLKIQNEFERRKLEAEIGLAENKSNNEKWTYGNKGVSGTLVGGYNKAIEQITTPWWNSVGSFLGENWENLRHSLFDGKEKPAPGATTAKDAAIPPAKVLERSIPASPARHSARDYKHVYDSYESRLRYYNSHVPRRWQKLY